ncbi:4-hydroxythreonine-4-phosphate dehydrogenase PdxA [Pseudonocardia eucalypti]|uniref:4-hydroxythreonine-4-phosphate dehydrogenase PdxA n=1 Tax=Pseudonocardia eucalypti TaxID=648755 RepID=A0ABP9RBF5_9PSEU|nr:4-hydroxythreonine-4-phosphate dehydrogenase [Pseudonocardia eucalypti]
MNPPVIGLTMGDPAGVGPEITVAALADPSLRGLARPLVVADAGVIERAIQAAGLPLEVRRVAGPEDVTGEHDVVHVLDLDNLGDVEFGRVRGEYGAAAVESIEVTCALAREGRIDAVVTAPINKEAIRAGGSGFPGHTEMLGSLFGVPPAQVVTMFVLEKLRIFFLTRHHPLATAIAQLTTEQVRDGLLRVNELLGELGFTDPHIALAALNPHAGENGLIGSEENEILGPAVAAARARGVDAVGPVPADAVFFQARQGRYDGVLSLYHDQGHIAAKTVDFFGTVSCTLGLPVLRASVDHGTAFDIAGKGIADPGGQVAAMRVAAELAPGVLRVRGRKPAPTPIQSPQHGDSVTSAGGQQ